MILREYQSACGTLLLGVNGDKLCLCDWMVKGRIEKTLRRLRRNQLEEGLCDRTAILDLVEEQLNEYFAGRLQKFTLPIETFGTQFQRCVWDALTVIPYGAAVSYKSIAESLGCGGSVRAVANAIGANALSIVIPCHRVIGSTGTLGGYAGGINAKRHLLTLERHQKAQWSRTPGSKLSVLNKRR